MAVLPNAQKPDRESSKINKSMFQIKEQDPSPQIFNEIDVGNLLDGKFKIIVIKMFTKIRRANMSKGFQQSNRKY